MRAGTLGLVVPVLLAAALWPGGASAAAVVSTNKLYTLDADFDRGALTNVNHDAPGADQLQLNRTTGTFGFIWVALSQRCTIAKIDTDTGVIKGEYRTASDGTSCGESSRTTVGLDGSVWVGHRFNGRITHVTLQEANNCVDRNGNGTIETSSGYGDVKPWPGNGAPASAAQDECILHHVGTSGVDSRHMSIDADNNLWVGDRAGGSVFRKYDGSTAGLLEGPHTFPCGGYGGLIDANGVIWSATSGGSVLRWDTSQPTATAQCLPYNNYGLAIDSQGNVWVSTLGEGIVRKLSPSGALLGTFNQGTTNAQGLAVDGNDHVWISSSLFCGGSCPISHLRNDGTLVGSVVLSNGAGPTGVAVDGNGKIWSANRSSHTATRIDPTGGPVKDGTPLGAQDLTVDFPAGPDGRPLPSPYNYSDMTGAQLLSNTSPQGTWTVTQDGSNAGTEWGRVTWNTESAAAIPPGSSITLEVRAADTEAGLGAVSYVPVTNGAAFSLVGRFLQVRATLRPGPGPDGLRPVLSDIRVEVAPKPADLELALATTPQSVLTGADVTATGTVKNAGPNPATDVVVTLAVPAGLTALSASSSQGTCVITDVITCSIGSLAVGQIVTLTSVLRAATAGAYEVTGTARGGQPDPDELDNVAKAPVTATAPQSGPVNPLQALLDCSGRKLVLLDVIPVKGGKAKLAGFADPTLAGQTLTITQNRRAKVKTTIAPDGTFAATTSAPKKGVVRYQAVLGKFKSLDLKLDRRIADVKVAVKDGRVVFSGRLMVKEGLTLDLFTRDSSCGPYDRIASALRVPRNGRFTISTPVPEGLPVGIFRVRIKLPYGFETFSLPRAVKLR